MNRYPILLLLPLSLLGSACSSDNTLENKTQAPSIDTPVVSATSAVDEKNGFRAFHFGDDVSQFSDLTPGISSREEGIKSYGMKQGKENLKIGDAKLQSIEYTFYHDKLYHVDLIVDGSDNLAKVTAAATSLYGEPSSTISGNGVKWEGQKVEARTLSVQRGGLAGGTTGYLRIKSKLIEQQVEAAKTDAAKKGSADL
ncbi:hypothetical protein [Hymenobacter rubripertinctus]|uniref:Uncharacterized protein n=1 Tax=Hymenobacter rubripertinctus TaxID=2029981 RepID=A0A418QNM3_9BACT|nr:hypothetical protein [Hymenobacter rubripertinctus]RIY06640.1 hypothetical protein D0T11_18385 [Hymenobacter rubripertinctus]